MYAAIFSNVSPAAGAGANATVGHWERWGAGNENDPRGEGDGETEARGDISSS